MEVDSDEEDSQARRPKLGRSIIALNGAAKKLLEENGERQSDSFTSLTKN